MSDRSDTTTHTDYLHQAVDYFGRKFTPASILAGYDACVDKVVEDGRAWVDWERRNMDHTHVLAFTHATIDELQPDIAYDIAHTIRDLYDNNRPVYLQQGLSLIFIELLRWRKITNEVETQTHEHHHEHLHALEKELRGSTSRVNDDIGKLSRRVDRVEEEMRGSVCGAPTLSQTLQKLLERVESLERLTEVLRGDVVKATSLASHYKREMDDLSRRFDDATAKNRVQVQDLLHENREIRQQLDQTTRQLSELSDARHLESVQQNDCEIASLSRRTDELASEVTKLRSEAQRPPSSRPTVSAAAQTDPSGIPAPLPPGLPQRNRSPAPRPPPSRSSSVPARPRASWSRPSSPGLGADSPNWRRPLPLLVDGSHCSPSTAIRPHRHRETDFATRSGECPYCHRPWNRRSPRRRRIPNFKAA